MPDTLLLTKNKRRSYKSFTTSNREASVCCGKNVVNENVRNALADLYNSQAFQFPLIAAVIENQQTGRVFANSNESPTHAFVINKFGFCQEFYSEFDEAFFDKVKNIIFSHDRMKFRCYAPTQDMESFLMNLDFAVLAHRKHYKYVGDQNPSIDFLYTRRMTEHDLEVIDFDLDLTNRYYDGSKDFLDNACPIVGVDNDKPIGICYSAGNGNNQAEIDVFVEEQYRRCGIGTNLVEKFAQLIKEKGYLPSWDCYSNNKGSMLLAKRLGFVLAFEYKFFNINVI